MGFGNWTFAWQCVLLIWNLKLAASLDCLSCNNITNITDCHTYVQCAQDEYCFTTVIGLGSSARFSLGCRSLQQCRQAVVGSTTSLGVSIIGRHVRDDVTSCDQCCHVDTCNRRLCIHSTEVITSTDGQCEDNSDYNCELVSGAFNICQDLHHAKTFCRKWCGLCNFTDGSWSEWTPWDSCDVTCGVGLKSRSRSCTNPKPSVGGLDCVGNNTNVTGCVLDTCPVHGNWTSWTGWGSCSVTCGVGLGRRDRACSQPIPGPNGHPCVGDSHEDRVCMDMACTDGKWSIWSEWNSCTATCSGGIREKHRTCNNPAPSVLGKGCVGKLAEYESCNNENCPSPSVYFTVTTPTGKLSGTGNPLFSIVVENVGNGYNTTTGVFNCPISGLYQFSFSFVGYSSSSTDFFCNLLRNATALTYVLTHVDDHYQHVSSSINIHLNKGDTLYWSGCSSNWNTVIIRNYSGMFTGALMQRT